jgi:NAD(P)-dependent dehydrogenase (short-subunit alcohol dehydrogenase family)
VSGRSERERLRLDGAIAVVTGSSSGNGRAIALALAREGAAVVCSDLHRTPRQGGYGETAATDALITDDGGRATFVRADVQVAAEVEALAEAAVKNYGTLDIWVNNAAVLAGRQSIVDESERQFDLTAAVNIKGVWLGCREALRQMDRQELRGRRSRGRIINIASIAALVGLVDEPAYSASKAAVVGLTRQLAVQWAPRRINVNAVCPGFIPTAMARPILEQTNVAAEIERASPWPELGTPSDVSQTVVFFASDDAAWISGQALAVDGGYTAA